MWRLGNAEHLLQFLVTTANEALSEMDAPNKTERDRATLSPTTRSNEMWSRIVETGLEADTGASLPLAHLLGVSVVTERLDLDRIWELTGWLVGLSP